MIDKDNVSLSFYWLILCAPTVDKGGILIAIFNEVGIIGMDSLPMTIDHNLSTLKTNNSWCCQLLK